MQNVEVKARCTDLGPVRAILAGEGLSRVSRTRQVDTYFVTGQGRLKLREVDGAQRVELIGYRRPDLPMMRAAIFTIAKVTDVEATRSVLAGVLGTRIVVSKTRELYQWDATRVHLDDVDGLGTFVELETAAYGEEVETARRACLKAFLTLGLAEAETIAGSYADLLEAARASA